MGRKQGGQWAYYPLSLLGDREWSVVWFMRADAATAQPTLAGLNWRWQNWDVTPTL